MTTDPRRSVLRLDGRAVRLGYRLGAEALLIVLDLAARSTETPDGPVVAVSYRDLARRLGISKDTAGRRVARLRGAGVLQDCPRDSGDRFEVCSYVLCLDRVGIAIERAEAVAA